MVKGDEPTAEGRPLPWKLACYKASVVLAAMELGQAEDLRPGPGALLPPNVRPRLPAFV